MAICAPKMTVAVDSEAAKFSMLWFSLRWAEPAPVVPVDCAALLVADMMSYVCVCVGGGGGGGGGGAGEVVL